MFHTLLIPFDLESIEFHGFVGRDAGFLAADGNLFFNAVHAFEVGQEQAPAVSSLYDYSIFSGVKLFLAFDRLRGSQDIHAVIEVF